MTDALWYRCTCGRHFAVLAIELTRSMADDVYWLSCPYCERHYHRDEALDGEPGGEQP